LDEHVFDIKNNRTSAYISTSKLKRIGINFAINRQKDIGGTRDGYLYTICEPKGGIDINLKYGREHDYAYQEEIAFEDQILRRYIIGGTKYFQNAEEGKTQINPRYRP
jgi:Heat-labile enterotoxin alpha chain